VRDGKPRRATRSKPPTSFEAKAPCQVWSWDITWLPGPISGAFFYLYLIVDIFSRKIVGWEVHDRETAEFAAQVLERAVWAEKCRTSPLALHADNGSPMKGATMKVTMERLGVTASFSRPRVSNDNAFSEALFRTCKYVPNWPTRGFATIDEARTWVQGFVRWYNLEHLHSALRFVTPDQRHRGEDRPLLAERHRVLGRVEVADVGHQEAQGVAVHAAVQQYQALFLGFLGHGARQIGTGLMTGFFT
jgi:transposase InsO family protein